MNKKTAAALFIGFMVIQFLISCRIFVTFESMAAYAASKDSIMQIEEQLNRIEGKIDKLMGF